MKPTRRTIVTCVKRKREWESERVIGKIPLGLKGALPPSLSRSPSPAPLEVVVNIKRTTFDLGAISVIGSTFARLGRSVQWHGAVAV